MFQDNWLIHRIASWKRKPLESIGGVSAEDILQLAYNTNQSWFDIFSGKSIMDVGAGFSPLLKIISKNSTPKNLVAIDPIYHWKEKGAAEQTKASVKNFIDKIMRCFFDEYQKLLLQNAERQIRDVEEFSYEPNIHYRTSTYQISPNQQQDIIFLSSTLYVIEDPKKFLQELDFLLKSDGEMVIIDFIDGRGNQIYKKLIHAGIEIVSTSGNYFCAKLKKWECSKIQWK